MDNQYTTGYREDKQSEYNSKPMGEDQYQYQSPSEMICHVRISWTDCIKFWLSSFIAIILIWIVIMVFFAGAIGTLFHGSGF